MILITFFLSIQKKSIDYEWFWLTVIVVYMKKHFDFGFFFFFFGFCFLCHVFCMFNSINLINMWYCILINYFILGSQANQLLLFCLFFSVRQSVMYVYFTYYVCFTYLCLLCMFHSVRRSVMLVSFIIFFFSF